MKQEIDKIFSKLKLDRNNSPMDLIKQIEATYNESLIYINNNAKDEKETTRYINYAHVLFSKKILDYVSIDDFRKYIEMQETINEINNHILDRTDPTGGHVKKLKPNNLK